jgi:4-amino-4-deoxy-L-arabinose transferase-like glycosyltransferase
MRGPWMVAAGIALIVLCVYLFAASRTTLWDRDEAWYGRPAVEMLESGDYIVPRFNGEMWTDKPILYYWLEAAAIRLFGPTAFACRIWSAVGTAATCLLTFAIAKRLLNAQAGLWAMLILASSLMILGTGTMALIEGILLPIMTATMLVFIHVLLSRPRWWHAAAMGCTFGLGMLAKGPMGLFPLPAMIVTLYLIRKTEVPIRRHALNILAALVIGSAMFLAWAIPVQMATHGEFLRRFFDREVFHRSLSPMESHGGRFFLYLPYYLGVIVVGFFPWAMYLPGALSTMFGKRLGGERLRAVLIGWIVPLPILMTLAATKLPHYILFIWPGLALATAAIITGIEEQTWTPRDHRWLQWGGWLFAVPAFGTAAALAVGPWFVAIPGLRLWGLVSATILSMMAVLVLRQLHASRLQAAAKATGTGMIVLVCPLFLGVLSALEAVKVTPEIAAAINSVTAKEVPLATYRFGEPSLNFYVGRHIEVLPNAEAVADWARQHEPGVLVIPRPDFEEIAQRDGSLPLKPIVSKRGFNYSKGKPIELTAVVRGERAE